MERRRCGRGRRGCWRRGSAVGLYPIPHPAVTRGKDLALEVVVAAGFVGAAEAVVDVADFVGDEV